MEAERYSLTLHFSASIFLPLSVAGPASPSSLGVLRSTSFGCGGAAPGSSVVEIIALVFLIPKISDLFWGAIIIFCLIFALGGMILALQGKKWKIPFIGDLADKIKI